MYTIIDKNRFKIPIAIYLIFLYQVALKINHVFSVDHLIFHFPTPQFYPAIHPLSVYGSITGLPYIYRLYT